MLNIVLDKSIYGRQGSNLHGRRGAGGLTTGECPAAPKAAVYANFTTPASLEVDAHSTIGDNQATYSPSCSQGPRGGYASKTIPLGGLGLGPLAGHGLDDATDCLLADLPIQHVGLVVRGRRCPMAGKGCDPLHRLFRSGP